MRRPGKRRSNSPEYQQKCEQAKESDDPSHLATLRKETLDNDPAFMSAAFKLSQAKAAYEQVRAELFARDEKWTAADDDLKDQKKALEEAEHDFRTALVKKKKAESDAKKAAAAAAAQAADQPQSSGRRGRGRRD